MIRNAATGIRVAMCASFIRLACGSLATALLAACGGGSSEGSASGSVEYTLGGSVSGLNGSGLVLQSNSGETLAVMANGTFTFHATLTSGSSYYVVTAVQPVSPAQTCKVANASGTIAGANVTDVQVVCSDKTNASTDSIGETLVGVRGSGLVLQNNGGDNLAVSTDGSFTFALVIPGGTSYDVSVLSPPIDPYEDCIVANGSGTTGGSDVANVVVSCTVNNNPRHSISGTITGVSGTVVLQDNGRDDVTVSADGPFRFPLTIPQGSVYQVTTKSVAGGQSQACNFENASGVVGDHDVTGVLVTCNANVPLNVAVAGLSGTGLVLQNNGTDDLAVKTNGTVSFRTALRSGDTYAVTVATQPTNPSQTCTTTNGTGTVAAGATVSITCTTNQYAVGGVVMGLPDSAPNATLNLGLQNNLGDDISISPAATSPYSFTFKTRILSGSTYSVTVKSQPGVDTTYGLAPPGVVQTDMVCVVSQGSGTVTNADVTGVLINCFHPVGFAYVTNSADNTVSTYLVDNSTGALVASGPAVPSGTSPAAAVAMVSAAGSVLYVANKGSNDISVYVVDANTGTLTAAPGSPIALAVGAPTTITSYSASTGKVLYVTTDGGTGQPGQIAAFSIGSTPTTLTLLGQVTTGVHPGAAGVYGAGTGFYCAVANSADSTISTYAIGNTGGLTLLQNAVPAGGLPASITSLRTFVSTQTYDYVYVANSADGSISAYSADPQTGSLASLGTPVTVGAGLNSLATDRSANLYATSSQGVWKIAAATNGQLTVPQAGPVPAGAGPGSIGTLRSDLYINNIIDRTVATFHDPGTTATQLTPNPAAPVKAGSGASSIVVTYRPTFGG